MSHKAQSNQQVTANEPEGEVARGPVAHPIETRVQPDAPSKEEEERRVREELEAMMMDDAAAQPLPRSPTIETRVQPDASSKEEESSVHPRVVRGIVFSKIPGHEHLHFLSARDIVHFDTAMSARGEREYLLESYVNMRSAGFDEHVYNDANDFEGLRWVRKREVDVRSLKLVYKGERDVDQVLWLLVHVKKQKDMATYYALRSEARNTHVYQGSRLTPTPTSTYFMPTTLNKASKLGYLTVVRCLVERGADVNEVGRFDCRTPLHWASENGHLEVVKVLLAAQADVNIADYDGKTPLSIARRFNHTKIAALLREAGAHE